jgi:ADP-ribosylglycohydrolase
MHKQTPFCEKGDQFNNGNGSLMRLAPIPIVFRDNK